MTRRLLLAALLALYCGVAAAAGGIVWQKDIDEAKKAAAGKKPIAVVLVQKGCPLSHELMKALPKDERVADLAPSFAWLSVTVGTDEYRNWFVATCGGNVQGTPSIVFLNPKGENADPDYAGLPTVASADPDDLVPVLREVLQRAKQEEPEKDKAAVAAAVAKVDAAKTPGEAVAAWRAALRAGDGWHAEAKAMDDARAGIDKALQDGGAEMIRILREVRDAEEQRKAYETVKADYAGTPIADWAADELARLKAAKK